MPVSFTVEWISRPTLVHMVCSVFLVCLVCLVYLVFWLNETNQMNQINQINKTNQIDQTDRTFPGRAGHRSPAVPKWFFRNLLAAGDPFLTVRLVQMIEDVVGFRQHHVPILEDRNIVLA